jgi:2-polyprenyl-3-methyl-5-hydroxy-6-metoxy-1,4-benzoquinol methylase
MMDAERNIESQNDWFEKISQSYLQPPIYLNGKELPSFPSDLIQSNTTGQSGVATLKEAFIFYQDCSNVFTDLSHPLGASSRLLDFGAGWGRISRFFLRDIPLENIYGVDVMEEFVQICKQTFRSDNFFTCKPFPPTQIPTGQITHIVGYSVFSHLSEAACSAWMEEFHRMLSPGGIVAVTTRGRTFFDFCEGLKNERHTGYLEALSRMFSDFNAARARYDNGEFVHSNSEGVNGGGAMTSSFYGESFIPESYAATAYSKNFVLKKFIFDASRQSHPIMVFQKT